MCGFIWIYIPFLLEYTWHFSQVVAQFAEALQLSMTLCLLPRVYWLKKTTTLSMIKLLLHDINVYKCVCNGSQTVWKLRVVQFSSSCLLLHVSNAVGYITKCYCMWLFSICDLMKVTFRY